MKHLMQQAYVARTVSASHAHVGQYVDTTLPIPRLFVGCGDIRLIIVGQDPTVKNVTRRAEIDTVLDLNNSQGQLRKYVEMLCTEFKISLDKNVYATNACKCFWTDRPEDLRKQIDIDVLEATASHWLSILQYEVTQYPEVPIITLGQPVLTMLILDKRKRQVRDYWGYHRQWESGKREPMHYAPANITTIARRLFPFPHQPSFYRPNGQFYRDNLHSYVKYTTSQ